MRSQLETFSPKKYQGPGSITYKRGTGSFTSNRFLRIDSSDNQSHEIESEYFLISTGSSPRRLNDIVPDQEHIFKLRSNRSVPRGSHGPDSAL